MESRFLCQKMYHSHQLATDEAGLSNYKPFTTQVNSLMPMFLTHGQKPRSVTRDFVHESKSRICLLPLKPRSRLSPNNYVIVTLHCRSVSLFGLSAFSFLFYDIVELKNSAL